MSRISIIKVILCFLLIIINGCLPAISAENLPIESDHPYANNFENTWTVSEPGADQIRLHFENLQLSSYDHLYILDKYDNRLKTYSYSSKTRQDLWTEWYTGDTLKIKLVTGSSGTSYGFKIDKSDTRLDGANSSSNSLAESDHPYANNFENTWTVSEPGADQIRLHFENLQLGSFDHLYLLNKYDNVVKTYSYSSKTRQDLWTEWYTGDTLKIKLVTGSSGTSYGFKIDKSDTRLDGANSSSESIDNSKSTVSEVQSNGTGTDENKVLTTTELTPSANPSTLGQSVKLIAKVGTPSQETKEPSGTVTFMDGTTAIGTKSLTSAQATLITSKLSGGSHSITAEYSGDNNFEPSTSSSFPLTVQDDNSNPSVQDDNSNPSVQDDNSNPSDHPDYTFILNNINSILGIIGTIVTIIVATRKFL